MFVPSNNLAKLGIGAANMNRIRLADQLFFPVAVNFANPAIPMFGGSVGNRAGRAVHLNSPGVAGNIGGYTADFSPITGDTISVVRKFTSDGVEYQVADYQGRQLAIEAPQASHPVYGTGVAGDIDWDNNGTVDASDTPPALPGAIALLKGTPRYIIKADGIIYDCLEMRSSDNSQIKPTPGGGYQHWEFAAAAGPPTFYNSTDNTYDAQAALTSLGGNLAAAHYTRPVGRISFRPKSGAGAQVIQDHLGRAQTSLDALSRVLRSLNDEAKGPFANLVIR